MKWSEQAWINARHIFEKTIQQPFIIQLSEGTLPAQLFSFYVQQDAWYLEHFGRSLALIGARAADTDDALAFMRFAEGAIVVERQLHQSFFQQFNIQERGHIEPACHHYIHYLKSTAATGEVAVAMAAVLPCFRVYLETGKHILGAATLAEHPYKSWIETYAGDAFEQLTLQATDICDRAAAQATPAVQQQMHEAFHTACLLEYDFWDAAYHLRKW